MAASQLSNRSRNTLSSWPLKRLTPNHVDLVGEGDNHVLVAAKPEIIGLDFFRVPLEGVWIFPPGEDPLHIPCDHEGASASDDGSLGSVEASVKLGSSEGEGLLSLCLHLRDVGGGETEASRTRLCVLRESLLEAEFPFILAFMLEGVNEQNIGPASCENPSTIGGNVKTNYCFAQGGNMCFGVDSQTIEHTNITFARGNCDIPILSGCRSGKVILRDILFELRINKFTATQARVHTIKGIVGQSEECLLVGHLSEFLVVLISNGP